MNEINMDANTEMNANTEMDANADLRCLEKALNECPDVHDFAVTQIITREKQIYLIGEHVEAKRDVANKKVMVEVFHDRDGKRGDANFYVDESGEIPLKQQIEEAVHIAELTGNPPFPLPADAEYPDVLIHDPASLEVEACDAFVCKLQNSVKSEKGVKLSAAELFARSVDTAFFNSRGARGRQKGTRLSLEMVLLDEQSQVECYGSRTRRRLSDFSLEQFVGMQSRYTRDALSARFPVSGNRPVIFVDKTLDNVFFPLVVKTSARSIFQKQSDLRPGIYLPGAENARGDLVSVSSDARLPWGMLSYSFDIQGLPGREVNIVDKGRVKNLWADARFSHYLGCESTGSFANLVVGPGTVAESELLKDQDALIVAAFSSFAPDPLTGRFASEIKVGYEYRDGRLIPVRGGSVTGNLLDFSDIVMSRERVNASHMVMPAAIRYGNMSVSGE